MRNQLKKCFLPLIYLIILLLLFNLASCSYTAKAQDMLSNLSAQQVESKNVDANFTNSATSFALNLIKNVVPGSENVLLSPISLMTSLSMATNGANGQTLSELTSLYKNISIDELNKYLKGYLNSLTSENDSKIRMANSIWFRDDPRLTIENSFLQTNVNYYDSQIYKAPFNNSTLQDINSWVKDNTDSMVDEILNEIKDEHIMYLLNAIAFDSKWDQQYEDKSVQNNTFTNQDKTTANISFMNSTETTFLDDGKAKGFLKPYKGGNFSFMALLPNEDISLEEYINGLNSKTFLNTLSNAKSEQVNCYIPKFNIDYSIQLNNALKSLGVNTAFDADAADFSKMGKSDGGNIYMSDVIQKAHIEVDEKGTKATAATITIMADKAAPIVCTNTVFLNRPFMYAIIDNNTNLPIFIGTVTQL